MECGLPPSEDRREREEVGRARGRSESISRIAERRLCPSPARRVAGMAIVGVLRT